MSFRPSLFPSFFLGGFECSTHRRVDGRRLDLIVGTRHDRYAAPDYRQLAEHGLRGARDGVRWHLVETAPGTYDWSPALPLLRAAEAAGVRVAWDLLHYGWPDGLDVWSAAFVDRFAAYAAAFARLHLEETGRPPFVCPVNEISFLAWGGGDRAHINPCASGRGGELKRQLVRAAIAGTRAVREAVPGSRFATIDPLINIVPRPGHDAAEVEHFNRGQWEAWDMLAGRQAPELGGAEDLLDVVGVNYYWNNQWIDQGMPLSPYDQRYRPFHVLLAEVQARYGRPTFLAETSVEGPHRPAWLRYVGDEVRLALEAGVRLEGVCLYPVLSHLGWDNDRYCDNGLFEMRVRGGRREVCAPLAAELRRQIALCAETLAAIAAREGSAVSDVGGRARRYAAEALTTAA